MVYVETIFIPFMELLRNFNFNGTVSIENKFHLKQTNSSLFVTKCLFIDCFLQVTMPVFSSDYNMKKSSSVSEA